jgi:hypothetical protein
MKMPRIAVLAALALLAIPSAASAAPPRLWGGEHFNDLGPAYALLAARNGQVKVKNVQLILACTDVEDGTESARAFDARFRNYTSMRLNRFRIDFSALSGGRLGYVRLRGVLRSNGTGAVRVHVDAVANGENGALVERCSGSTRIPLRRGG